MLSQLLGYQGHKNKPEKRELGLKEIGQIAS
jgi:hypothetical protein